MRVIIDGNKELRNNEAVKQAIESSGFDINEVVTAGRVGASSLGARWAQSNGILVRPFQPGDESMKTQQQTNRRMAKYADALILVTDQPDAISENLIEHAEKRDMPIHVQSIS